MPEIGSFDFSSPVIFTDLTDKIQLHLLNQTLFGFTERLERPGVASKQLDRTSTTAEVDATEEATTVHRGEELPIRAWKGREDFQGHRIQNRVG